MVNSNDVVKWGYLLDPCFQFQNTAGKPLTDGYIEVYIAGTRDKYYCASDFDGTLHPFQIPLDSLGANIVLADPEQAYDVYVYNKFGSLQMSRYNVSPGNAGGAVASNINITSSDNTINVTHTGNNYDLSIQDTIDRIDNLENLVSGITGETDYVISTGSGDNGNFVLTNKDYKGIQYLQDMSGWRLKPGHIYQLNFNSKFTLDDNYNTLVEGKLYLDGDMSFSQDWAYTLDDSFDHIKHINGSTVIVVPNTLQYYDLKLKYTFNSVVNCQVDLENISLVDITSIVLNDGSNDYHAGDGININNSHYISVDMDYINSQIDIDSKLSSAVNIANEYTDNSIEEVIALVSGVTGELQQVNSDWNATSGKAEILNKPDLSVYATHQEVINSVSAVSSVLEQEIQDIPEQVQSDWAQTNTSAVDYIKNKPEETSVEFTGLVAGNNVTITASGDNTVISADVDLTNYATHNEVHSATTSAINSANSYTDTAISNIDLSDYSTHTEVYNATSSAVSSANSYTDTAIANIDFSDYASHSEVYNSSVTAVGSAISYTDTAIANIDLTPAVEIVSPNNSISVSSVTDSVNNTKTFYLDTNNPETNYWIGEANLTLSDQSSQGVVGYYKDVFDYTTKFNGNLDATKLKKGLYLLTANVMIVADEVNNDLAEIQIHSNSSSAISYTSSVFQHDCSVADTLGEPLDESHQIATIVRVVYDDTPMSLIARMDAPTTITNTLKLWFSDIGLYELQGTSVGGGGGSSPSASGSYEAGWGVVINGNVISVNPNIIPDISNLASTTYVDNRIASAINIVESEIPDVSDMATETWVNNQGFLKSQVQSDWTEYNSSDPAYIKNKPLEANLVAGNNITITASGNNIIISSTSSGVTYRAGTGIDISGDIISVDNTVAMKSDINDMATKTWVGSQGYLTSIPSNYATDTEVANAIASAVSAIPSQVQSDWTEDDSNDPSYIQNKPETEAITLCPIIAGDNITITVSGDSAIISGQAGGSTYTAGTGIDITNDVISVDNTIATKSDVQAVEANVQIVSSAIPDVSNLATKAEVEVVSASIPDLPDEEEVEFEELDLSNYALASAIPDVSNLATKSELQTVSAAIPDTSDMATKTWVGNQSYVNSSTASAIAEAEVASVETLPIDICPIIPGNNITITASGSSAVISSTGGGGSSYTAGTGIDITNDVISVDNTVALKTDIPSVTGFATEAELAAVTATIPADNVRKINFNYSATLYSSQIESWINNNKFVYLNILPSSLPYSPDVLQYLFASGGGNLVLNNFIRNNYVTFSGICRNSLTNKDYTVVFTYTFGSNSWSYSCNRVITYTNDIANLASKSYVDEAIADIDVPVSGASGITVTDNVVALDNPVGLVAGENITITVSGDSAIIAGQAGGSTYSAGTGIDITNNTISVDNTIATKSEIPTLPDEEEIEFEEIDLSDYALASAIPDTTGMVTYTGNTAINHIQLVSTLPASPDANTLYLIPEA